MRFSDAFKENFWTISNFLSVLRVLMLPYYVYEGFRYRENPVGWSLYIMASMVGIAVLTDYLDGFLARKMNQVTIVGRYLDPICDKIVTLGAMCDAALFYGFPWFVFAFCVFREILGVWMGSYLYFKRDIQGRPNIWGKLGVGVVAISILWYVLIPYFKHAGYGGYLMQPELSAWGIVAVVTIGMFSYSWTYWDIIVHGQKKS